MAISAPDERVKDIEITEDTLSVALMDGRITSVPLVWYPRLLDASDAERGTGGSPEAATASTGRTWTKT